MGANGHHSTRSPVLRRGHLIQRPQFKHSPHRFKPMQRTTGIHSESGTVLDWRTDAAHPYMDYLDAYEPNPGSPEAVP
jgi:hypothetical protein